MTIAKLIYAEEVEEWTESYPGDPLVRPAALRLYFGTIDPEALEEWFTEAMADRFSIETSLPGVRHPSYGLGSPGVNFPVFPTSLHERETDETLLVVSFFDKDDFLMAKLAWG